LENTRIELGDEVQSMTVKLADGEPLHLGSRQQFLAQIDAEHVGAGRLDLGGQRAVAAAEVEDTLARPWRQHGEDGTGHLLHEAAVACIVGRRPALDGLRRRDFMHRFGCHCGCHGS
jgi:hypothetical protein